jgi:hypothetical protein
MCLPPQAASAAHLSIGDDVIAADDPCIASMKEVLREAKIAANMAGRDRREAIEDAQQRTSGMDILHRVAKAAKETSEVRHHDHDAVARAAIATMFNWLSDPPQPAVDAAVAAGHGHVDARICRVVWSTVLAEMRKEAGF